MRHLLILALARRQQGDKAAGSRFSLFRARKQGEAASSRLHPWRRGSALIIALWVIMVLSVFIMNFAVEAKLQAGVNVYIRNRTHVDNLTKAGVVIAETIMLGYNNVTEPPDDETIEELQEKMEDNKWLREERDLKFASTVTTEPIVIDWKDPDGGSVVISIKFMEAQGWNINNLYAGGDSNYRLIWENILEFAAGMDLDDTWQKRIADELICSWCDWRDPDDSLSSEGEAEGGEQAYYRDELEYREGEKHYKPRNGAITDLKELAKVKGFRDYPAILTGGVLNPEAREGDQVKVNSILGVLTVYGNNKIPVNAAGPELLMTVPGIDGDAEIVEAIVELREEPEEEQSGFGSDDYGRFKNWADMQNRLSEQIDAKASEYFTFDTSSTSGNFDLEITGRLGDITHTIRATARVEDSKIKYIRWQEDP